jgi:nicotinate phosphoribosyltransferase
MAIEGMANFTDLYQLTMMNGYAMAGKKDDEVIFDLFFRNNPFEIGFTIVAGLEQAIDYL